MDTKKEAILKAARDLTENYDKEELFMPKNGRSLPNRAVIIDLVRDLRSVIFPGYFGEDTAARMFPGQFTAYLLNDFYDRMKKQVEIAFLYADQNMEKKKRKKSQRISARIFSGSFQRCRRGF